MRIRILCFMMLLFAAPLASAFTESADQTASMTEVSYEGKSADDAYPELQDEKITIQGLVKSQRHCPACATGSLCEPCPPDALMVTVTQGPLAWTDISVIVPNGWQQLQDGSQYKMILQKFENSNEYALVAYELAP